MLCEAKVMPVSVCTYVVNQHALHFFGGGGGGGGRTLVLQTYIQYCSMEIY